MRIIGLVCLSFNFFAIPCFGQNQPFLTSNRETVDQSTDQRKGSETATHQQKEKIKELEKRAKALLEEGQKQKDIFQQHSLQKQVENQQKLEQLTENFKKQGQEFDETREKFQKSFQTEKEKFKQDFHEKQEEFDALRQQLIEELKKRSPVTSLNSGSSCSHCMGQEALFLEDSPLLVFISFSLPDQAWLSLARDMQHVGGAFVLRGLPQQSFQALASHLLHLKEQGVEVPIHLDPKKFTLYDIHQVPTFVIVEGQLIDKVAGHVSLAFALETMSKKGETKTAKTLYQMLREKG